MRDGGFDRPNREPPGDRLRRARAAHLRAVGESLLQAVRRVEEDARRGGGEEPPARHAEPEGAPADGGDRGDGAEGAADLQPARPLRLLPDHRRRRRGRSSAAPTCATQFTRPSRSGRQGHRARRGLRPAVLQAELRLRRLRRRRVRAAGAAYATGRRSTPRDVDFAEVHDCFTITEILNYEDLGFCARGEGGRFVEEGRAALGGEKPVNPSRRPQVVRPPDRRHRRAHDLRARRTQLRGTRRRRARCKDAEHRPRPQPGRSRGRLLRVDPDQPGLSARPCRAAAFAA